jgi:hypothetical protein
VGSNHRPPVPQAAGQDDHLMLGREFFGHRTSFAPETAKTKHNERDQTGTKPQQKQRT